MNNKTINVAIFLWHITVLFFLAVVLGCLLWVLSSHEKTVGYDCQLAEISPDVPLMYKEACRKERMKK